MCPAAAGLQTPPLRGSRKQVHPTAICACLQARLCCSARTQIFRSRRLQAVLLRADRRSASVPCHKSSPESSLRAPYTSVPTRDCSMAPAHIAHGSSVEYITASSSRQLLSRFAARCMHRISACAIGSPVVIVLLCARATISSRNTSTAPTGTSPAAAPCSRGCTVLWSSTSPHAASQESTAAQCAPFWLLPALPPCEYGHAAPRHCCPADPPPEAHISTAVAVLMQRCRKKTNFAICLLTSERIAAAGACGCNSRCSTAACAPTTGRSAATRTA